MTYDWPIEPEIEARCMSGGGWYGSPPTDPTHFAPDEKCRCGFYARTRVQALLEEYPYYPLHGYYAGRAQTGYLVMGAVLMWGEVMRGEKVIRAQSVRVLCLTDLPDPWYKKIGAHDPSRVGEEERHARDYSIDMVREAYRLPMIPYSSVEVYAKEFGDLV